MVTSRKPTKKRAAPKKRTASHSPRRRPSRPGLPTTVGTALGTLAVATLLDASWPVRIGLLVLVLVLGSGYVLWKARHEIAASATSTPTDHGSSDLAPSSPAGAGPNPVVNPADEPGSPDPVAG